MKNTSAVIFCLLNALIDVYKRQIMGIVTAVIIVIVIIYLALSVAGVFKFGGKKNSESQQTESQLSLIHI